MTRDTLLKELDVSDSNGPQECRRCASDGNSGHY